MTVVPDVIDAIKGFPSMHVLAAGGIATGRQVGAAGAWCGYAWLITVEAETTYTVTQKISRLGREHIAIAQPH